MTKKIPLLLGAALVALTVAACEGPVGPAGQDGAAGAAGPQGPAGPAGPAGADALNTCVQCHGHDATLVALEEQFKASPHHLSAYWHRQGGGCAACHMHQGFMDVVAGEPVKDLYENPAPINCRTCHEIHTTFTQADYALTTTSPVDLNMGDVFDVGNGNLCANCHQARPHARPEIGGTDPFTVGNFRFGPHYGTQANVLVGEGLFHFDGTATIPADESANPHLLDCSSCHLQPAVGGHGVDAGGHTFQLSYMSNANKVDLVSACTDCHSSATSFNHFTGQTGTQTQLNTLRELLIAEGIMNADNVYATTGDFHPDVVAAFLNWKYFYYDGSLGVHYPRFTWAVLNNTIQAMQARQ